MQRKRERESGKDRSTSHACASLLVPTFLPALCLLTNLSLPFCLLLFHCFFWFVLMYGVQDVNSELRAAMS